MSIFLQDVAWNSKTVLVPPTGPFPTAVGGEPHSVRTPRHALSAPGLMSIPTHRVTRYITSAEHQWQPAVWRSCHRGSSSRQVTCVLRSHRSTDRGCSDRHRDSGPVSHSLSQNATVSRSKAYFILCFLGSLHLLYLSTLRSQLIPVWAVSGMSKRPGIWVRQKRG